jgi:hypothetical protein
MGINHTFHQAFIYFPSILKIFKNLLAIAMIEIWRLSWLTANHKVFNLNNINYLYSALRFCKTQKKSCSTERRNSSSGFSYSYDVAANL